MCTYFLNSSTIFTTLLLSDLQFLCSSWLLLSFLSSFTESFCCFSFQKTHSSLSCEGTCFVFYFVFFYLNHYLLLFTLLIVLIVVLLHLVSRKKNLCLNFLCSLFFVLPPSPFFENLYLIFCQTSLPSQFVFLRNC